MNSSVKNTAKKPVKLKETKKLKDKNSIDFSLGARARTKDGKLVWG
jgi:hypothetical protein